MLLFTEELMQEQKHIKIQAGNIVRFYYQDAGKKKYAVNLEVLRVNKKSITGVLMTTKKMDQIYPGDYVLPRGIMPMPTKVICDEPIKIYKKDVDGIIGNVGPIILKEIRQKVGEALDIC